MKDNCAVFVTAVLCGTLFSCASLISVPPPERIMGQGRVRQEVMTHFLCDYNPALEKNYAQEISRYYLEEADREGVNHDVAFAQMCLETGYLKFQGLVTRDMNNFCGLGATDSQHIGERFPSLRTGVRAHIQHLKAYASTEPLNQGLVDNRFKYVKRGTAPTVYDLAGRWATDRDYGAKIIKILTSLYSY